MPSFPDGRNTLRKRLLSASIALTFSAAANAQAIKVNLPEQPLAQSIMELVEKAGITIGGDSTLLSGKLSQKLSGNYEPEQALRILLQNSGVSLQQHPDGYLVLMANKKAPLKLRKNKKLNVTAKPLDEFGGSSFLNKKDINHMPQGNGNLSDLLGRLPGVNSTDIGRGSEGAGELTPDNISINGARFFQNSFMVDGISINNDIDPGFSDPNNQNRIGSNSQGLYVDLNSIESVTVLDHSVSAEYGGFVGGVVDVKTKRYNNINGLNLSWRHSNDSLAKYHYTAEDADKFTDGELPLHTASTLIQPNFTKNFYTLGGAIGLSKNWGTVFNLSRKRSVIPFSNIGTQGFSISHKGQLTETVAMADGMINQYREHDGATIKTSYQPSDGQILDIKLLYGKAKSSYQLGGAPGSNFTLNHNNLTLGLAYIKPLNWGELMVKADISNMEDVRESSNDTFASITGLSIGRNDIAGGVSPLNRQQKSKTLSSTLKLKTLTIGGSEHQFAAGFSYNNKDIEEQKNLFSSTHVYTCFGSCTKIDQLTYLARVNIEPYELAVDFTNKGFWLEDTISLGNAQIRPGLRYDANNYLKESTTAPRLAISYDLFGDGNSTINLGLNRYYGRAFAELEAQRLRDLARTTIIFPETANIVTPPSTQRDQFVNLATPYDDEIALGFTHNFNLWDINLHWVHRKGRDQISNKLDPETRIKSFNNDGRSETDNVTLEIKSIDSYDFASAQWFVDAQVSWSQRTSNQLKELQAGEAVYDQGLPVINGEITRSDKVYYKGEVINTEQLPANAFTSPIRAQINLRAIWQEQNLTLNNYITWANKYLIVKEEDIYEDLSSGDILRNYEDVEYSSSFNWDMKLRWEPKILSSADTYIQVDVLNVLDKTNIAKGRSTTKRYQIGRQFWLEMGVKF